MQLTGVIAAMPQLGAEGTRFVFEIEQSTLDGQEVTVPHRVSLDWYRGFDADPLIAGAMTFCCSAIAISTMSAARSLCWRTATCAP